MLRIPQSKKQLTPLELRIMQVLWTDGPSLVQAVQSCLGEDLAYTTVQTMLNILQRKGHVSRKLVGRAYEYRALRNRDSAQGNAIHDLLSRMFDGSVEGMVMNMVRTKQIDATKLSEIAKRVAELEGEPNADRK